MRFPPLRLPPALLQVSSFQSLSYPLRVALSYSLEPVIFTRGELLFREGDMPFVRRAVLAHLCVRLHAGLGGSCVRGMAFCCVQDGPDSVDRAVHGEEVDCQGPCHGVHLPLSRPAHPHVEAPPRTITQFRSPQAPPFMF